MKTGPKTSSSSASGEPKTVWWSGSGGWNPACAATDPPAGLRPGDTQSEPRPPGRKVLGERGRDDERDVDPIVAQVLPRPALVRRGRDLEVADPAGGARERRREACPGGPPAAGHPD